MVQIEEVAAADILFDKRADVDARAVTI